MGWPWKHHVAKVKVTCLQCGTVFERFPSQAKAARFCSFSCKGKHLMAHKDQSGENNPSWKGGRAKFTCAQCGKVFEDYLRNDGRKDRTLCSKACEGESKKRRVKITCKYCGKTVERMASQDGPYCSMRCFGKDIGQLKNLKGEKHWNWKGGVTPPNRSARTSAKFRGWRKAVFERDGYACAVCGKDKPRLHAHHILEFAEYPDRRYDADNGVTLCAFHHQMLHPNMVLTDFRKHYIDGYDNSIGGVIASLGLNEGLTC